MLGALAQEVTVKRSDVIEQLKGVPYYIHFVGKGETLSAIAEAYKVSAAEITRLNPEIASGLKANQVLKIPVEGDYVVKTSATEPSLDEMAQRQQPPSAGGTHKVEPRETWYGISRLYQVPVKELIMANQGIDTLRPGMQIIIPVAGKPAPKPGYRTHTIQAHETLYSLSKQYGVSISSIVDANPGSDEVLSVGQIVYIPENDSPKNTKSGTEIKPPVASPASIQYVVERKETLYSIARRYNVDINDILNANPGIGGELRKGSVLSIPVKQNIGKTADNEVVEQKQTAVQVVAPVETQPCSGSIGGTRHLSVAIMVPFQAELTDSIQTSDPSSLLPPSAYASFDFIQFYEGVLLAIDSLHKAGVDAEFYVYDADAGEHVNKTRQILARPEIAGMDLIIGPFFAKSFELVADFAARHSIPVVNPLSQRSGIIDGNPYVFKIQPSAWSQYDNAARILANKFRSANVLIYRKFSEDNSSMASAFKTAVAKYGAGNMVVKEASYSQSGEGGLFNNLVAGHKNVIFMLTDDKALLPALLRKLDESRKKYDISLVGLPSWESMEMDYHYLLNLNTHLFAPWFVDYTNPEVAKFVNAFTRQYKTDPSLTNQAFLGYDITFTFIKALNTYGRNFGECLASQPVDGLSSRFGFHKTEGGGFENAGCSVYELTDYSRRLTGR